MHPAAYIRYLAYDNFTSPWEQKTRMIMDNEILFIVSGTGEYVLDGKHHLFEPGQLLFVPPGVYHSQRSLTLPLVLWCIHFDLYGRGEEPPCPEISHGQSIRGCFFSGRGYAEELTIKKQPLNLPPLSTPDSMARLHLNRMTALLRGQTMADLSAAELLLPELIESLTDSPGPDQEDPLNVILEYIKGNYQKPLSLGVLSSILHLQPGYVGQLFKKRMGIPISEYLCLYRISAAKGLLRYTDEKLEGIAASCGFYDAPHFCRTFLLREGVSPSEYRRSYQKR